MIILHYFLGFPPFRTGGLTKYCMDLMCEQSLYGDKVIALWPGQICAISRKTRILKRKEKYNIENYEILNPLPIPYDEGIRDIGRFMVESEEEVYKKFLLLIKPDVIHVHTFMGIHKEFFKQAKALGIRVIFTTHDYFGLCPHLDFFCNGKLCNLDQDCRQCATCNQKALSYWKMIMLQTHLYAFLKDTWLIKIIRKKHKLNIKKTISEEKQLFEENICKKYALLREYFVDIMTLVDCFHYNSTVSSEIYSRFIGENRGIVIPITHKDAVDNRMNYKKNTKCYLRLAYLSPLNEKKGFFILKSALDELWDEGVRNFQLLLFGAVEDVAPYMKIEARSYTQEELPYLYQEIDILCAPSIWPETFGFVVLESLCNSVPVLITDLVGAKDIVGDAGIIISSMGDVKEQIKEEIKALSFKKLKQLTDNTQKCDLKQWTKLVQETYEIYRRE